MGCQQCGRQPGDLHCNYEAGCVNDEGYEPRNDWECVPAEKKPTARQRPKVADAEDAFNAEQAKIGGMPYGTYGGY